MNAWPTMILLSLPEIKVTSDAVFDCKVIIRSLTLMGKYLRKYWGLNFNSVCTQLIPFGIRQWVEDLLHLQDSFLWPVTQHFAQLCLLNGQKRENCHATVSTTSGRPCRATWIRVMGIIRPIWARKILRIMLLDINSAICMRNLSNQMNWDLDVRSF